MAWTDIPQYVIDDIFGFQNANQMVDNFDFLKAGGVGTVYLANLAVTAAKLGTNAVTNSKIGNLAVDTAELAAGAVTQGKLATSAGVTSGSIGIGVSVEFSMQDYCFSPNVYAATTDVFMEAQASTSTGTVGAFALNNNSGLARAYTVRWRYVTATDEPFIYAIQDKTTGEIEHLWMCEDPPPGYWGLDNKPDGFIPPIALNNGLSNKEEIIIFKHPKEEYFNIINKSDKDKKSPCEILNNGFEWDKGKKLFITKNLTEA